jgi:glycosyltransferase involved in cell wall biosynthesis
MATFREWIEKARVTESGISGENLPPVELLCWVGGDFSRVEPALDRTLSSLFRQCRHWPVTFLLDGPACRHWPAADYYIPMFSHRREIMLSGSTDLPAVLYSLGILHSKSDRVAFLWPGCEARPDRWLQLEKGSRPSEFVYGNYEGISLEKAQSRLDSWTLRQQGGVAVPVPLTHPVQQGWLQMFDALPMSDCLVSPKVVRDHGCLFDPSPLLQWAFWWDFTVRFSRFVPAVHVQGEEGDCPVRWNDFPFKDKTGFNPDDIVRYMTGNSRELKSLEDLSRICEKPLETLDNDLAAEAAQRMENRLKSWWRGKKISTTNISRDIKKYSENPLRVLVVGGLYEPAHNQLCFYNYFEKVAGKGQISWRPVYEPYVLAEDIAENDVVIFSRPRSEAVLPLFDECEKLGIPTLVMIDDNWFAAGEELPEYKLLFSRGNPGFEAFIECLGRADAVLLYNKTLEEDVKPYAGNVIRISPNVALDLFPELEKEEDRKTFLAGYAGSIRRDIPAFRALAKFAQKHEDVRLFLMGHEIPPEWSDLPKDRLRFIPYQFNYPGYARTVSLLGADLMLAPLDETRFSASKCPNKYLEISAAGAAGIYSRVLPYTDYVEEGKNGLLVENEDDAWLEAMEKLYRDRALVRNISEEARRTIREKYSTEAVLPRFLEVLTELSEKSFREK